MVFRDYRREDYHGLILLWNVLGMTAEERGDTPEVIQRTIDQGGKLIVLEHEEKIIGSSWLTTDGRRMFLHHFCIDEAFQGKGLGMKLGEESMKFIREKGFQVKLEVHKENHAAKKLYEKLGFFAFTEYDIYMKRKVR